MGLSLRSSLLLGAPERELRQDIDLLANAERRWLGEVRRDCVEALPAGAQASQERLDELQQVCLSRVGELYSRLQAQPSLEDEPLAGGIPTTGSRLLDHGWLSFVGDAIGVELKMQALVSKLEAPEDLDPDVGPKVLAKQLDELGNAVIELQRGRIEDLARASRFVDHDLATILIVSEEVSGWMWLKPVDQPQLDLEL